MALRVSTTGSDVFIADLGIDIPHPTVNRDLALEFTALEIKGSEDLTAAIQSGDLDVDDGTHFIHQDDYDPDDLLIQQLGYNADLLFISHDELSAGQQDILIVSGVFPVALNSTSASTRNVYSPAARLITWQLEEGDIVEILGNVAAGIYTVESVTDQQNFVIEESILDSTGGTMNIYHPAGATRVGVDDSEFTVVSGQNLQEVLQSIDDELGEFSASGLSDDTHRELDQLVHDIAEDSYEEYTYTASRVATLTVWTDSSKTTKIREEQYTYSGNNVTTLVIIQYDTTGTEVERLTETFVYSGNKIQSTTRTLT